MTSPVLVPKNPIIQDITRITAKIYIAFFMASKFNRSYKKAQMYP
jgi:hypothetical protein